MARSNPRLRVVKNEEPKPRPRNPYADMFEVAFSEHFDGDPCDIQTKDFVQLARLIRLYKGQLEIDCFARAVKNYFASERMFYTLAHLCVNFAAYKRTAADRFNQPLIDIETEKPTPLRDMAIQSTAEDLESLGNFWEEYKAKGAARIN